MENNNIIFNEDMLFYEILKDTYKALTILKEKDPKSEEHKSINRIYGNIFVLFLRNGYKCTKEDIDGKTYYILTINNTKYECEESELKNILFKEFTQVINDSLIGK